MVTDWNITAETGEQRLQRMIDRRRGWTGRVILAGGVAAGALWLWQDGAFHEEGWDLIWILPLCLFVLIAWEALLDGIAAAATAVFRPILRPFMGAFSSRGYSYYEGDEGGGTTPDYSRAEVIVRDGDRLPAERNRHE